MTPRGHKKTRPLGGATGFFQGVELLRGSRCGSRSRSCAWAAGSGKQRCNSGNDSDFNDFHIWLFGCCLATGNPRLMLRTLTDLNYLASTEFGGLKSAKLLKKPRNSRKARNWMGWWHWSLTEYRRVQSTSRTKEAFSKIAKASGSSPVPMNLGGMPSWL